MRNICISINCQRQIEFVFFSAEWTEPTSNAKYLSMLCSMAIMFAFRESRDLCDDNLCDKFTIRQQKVSEKKR